MPQNEKPRASSVSSHLLARNTLWMLLGQGVKLLVQALYFIMMARNLGSHQYGAFIAVSSFALIVSAYVGNGFGNLMIKNVVRDRSVFSEYWGNALLVILGSGLLLSGFAVIAGLELWPQRIPVVVIVLVVASDALLSRFLEMAAWAFQSVEMLGWTAGLNVFSCVTRLAGIVAIVLLGRPTLRAWAMAYFVGSATSAVVAVACVCRRLDPPKLGLHRIKGELREGFYFSVSLSATTLYNDIDKTMLARMSALDATGIYAAAYRLIDVAFIPVRSLLAAAYPGFFRSGAQGISSSVAYAKRLLPKPVGYAVAVAFAMWVAAPLVPRVLGAEYARTTIALRWLALLPLLKTFHYLGADALTGAGYQGLRTLMQVLVAAFNILVNLWIIPAYSWRGAAWSSLASDGLLASAIWLSLRALAWQRQRRLALVEIRA